jgi:hypothetical protein
LRDVINQAKLRTFNGQIYSDRSNQTYFTYKRYIRLYKITVSCQITIIQIAKISLARRNQLSETPYTNRTLLNYFSYKWYITIIQRFYIYNTENQYSLNIQISTHSLKFLFHIRLKPTMNSNPQKTRIYVCMGGMWELVDGSFHYIPKGLFKRSLYIRIDSTFLSLLASVATKFSLDVNSGFKLTYKSGDDLIEVSDDDDATEFIHYVINNPNLKVTLYVVNPTTNNEDQIQNDVQPTTNAHGSRQYQAQQCIESSTGDQYHQNSLSHYGHDTYDYKHSQYHYGHDLHNYQYQHSTNVQPVFPEYNYSVDQEVEITNRIIFNTKTIIFKTNKTILRHPKTTNFQNITIPLMKKLNMSNMVQRMKQLTKMSRTKKNQVNRLIVAMMKITPFFKCPKMCSGTCPQSLKHLPRLSLHQNLSDITLLNMSSYVMFLKTKKN